VIFRWPVFEWLVTLDRRAIEIATSNDRAADDSCRDLPGVDNVEKPSSRTAAVQEFYQAYLVQQDTAAFIKSVTEQYTIGTLERLTAQGSRLTRRAAVLALGLVGGYESNSVLGRALQDKDRGVRTLAENGIRQLWCRAGNQQQRQQLGVVIRLNTARRFDEAVVRATELIETAPWFAEAWNQRAIANYQRGRHAESARDCHQVIEINPYHFAAVAGMGQCHLQLRNHVAALDCFRRALRLYPDMEGVRAHVAYLERALKRKGKKQ